MHGCAIGACTARVLITRRDYVSRLGLAERRTSASTDALAPISDESRE